MWQRFPMAIVATAAALILLALGAALTGSGQTTAGETTYCRMGAFPAEGHPLLGGTGTDVGFDQYTFDDKDRDFEIDLGEALYVDLDGTSATTVRTVGTPDVRWTDLDETRQAGTHPADGDADHGRPVTPFYAFNTTFADVNGNGVREADEPVVIDLDLDGLVGPNDRYLAPDEVAGLSAGAATAPGDFAEHPLTPYFFFVRWLDAGNAQDPADRVLFADLDHNRRFDPQDLCLSHHTFAPPTTQSPTATKTDGPTETPPQNQTTSPRTTTPTTGTTDDTTAQQPGGFSRDGGLFVGRYVRFVFDAESGGMESFAVSDVAFFERIDFACPCDVAVTTDGFGRATMVQIQGQDAFLLVNDQPSGLLTFASFGQEPLDFVIDPAVAAEATQTGEVGLSRDGRTAWISMRDAGADGGLDLVEDDAGRTHAALRGAGVFFVTVPAPQVGIFQENRASIEAAILDRRLSVEVQVLRTERGNEPQVLVYDAVSDVKVTHPADLQYELRVDADLTEPRAFLFQFPRETLDAEGVEVSYSRAETESDTFENVPLLGAATLADALDPRPGEAPKFFVESTPDGFQVAISVDRFSIQLFQVFGIPPETAPIFAYGVVLVFLFLGVAVVGVLVGRRGRPKWKPKRREIIPLADL